ncbi:unnamed protein product [Larinioides sclopetarius]|uniref:Uncharacterized protein n=1 Tax=Larinioides sclopetarius TaxID=280406 RepID=A0AAV1ZS31_9ARAC
MDRDQTELDCFQTETENVEILTESELESDTREQLTEYEMDGDKWHFAFDIVREVFHWILSIERSHSNVPTYGTFILTDVHKDDILDFLQQNGNELNKLVDESKRENDDWNYKDDNYLHCKRKVLEEYKPETYSEKEFVRLCAGIAFIAIGNQSVNQDRDVEHEATNELHAWINEVLMPGGTLQNSTWAQNKV